MSSRTWNVDVYMDEDDEGQTHAEAVLRTRAGTELGSGQYPVRDAGGLRDASAQ
jgi:hypothetical protein